MKQKKIVSGILAAVSTIVLVGCAATQTPDENSNGGSNMETAIVDNLESRSVTLADPEVTDPEFAEIIKGFTNEVDERNLLLDQRQKDLIGIVSLVVQQSDSMLHVQISDAIDGGVSPVEIREAVYQCAPYVGLPRVVEAISVMNGVFSEKGIPLPLDSQKTVDEDTRFEKGLDAQVAIGGEQFRTIAEVGAENLPFANYFLIMNCFGDYYTRDGLDMETREMLTLSMLVNFGTEAQIKGHITGNVNMGRDKAFIGEVIHACLPYAGYPRLLNTLGYLEEVLPEDEQAAQTAK